MSTERPTYGLTDGLRNGWDRVSGGWIQRRRRLQWDYRQQTDPVNVPEASRRLTACIAVPLRQDVAKTNCVSESAVAGRVELRCIRGIFRYLSFLPCDCVH